MHHFFPVIAHTHFKLIIVSLSLACMGKVGDHWLTQALGPSRWLPMRGDRCMGRRARK